jgi:glutaredoxin 3
VTPGAIRTVDIGRCVSSLQIMASVILYGRDDCEYSNAAKELLFKHGIYFEEIDIEHQYGKREEMIRRAGGRFTTPQIFIDGLHIGGADDLRQLASQGRLDALAQADAG